MALPFRDNLEPRRTPWVTITLMLLNAIVFLFVQPSAFQRPVSTESFDPAEYERAVDADRFTMRWAMVPCEIRSGSPVAESPSACDPAPTPHLPDTKSVPVSLLSTMFVHGNLEHLAGNMLFLWIFGRSVENRLGPLLHLGVYLIGGILASLTSVLASPGSSVPHIGASGAIAATMGAYLVGYLTARILVFVGPPLQLVYLPAPAVLALYFATQFFLGDDSGVAWQAHAGGMVAGVVLAIPLLRLASVRRRERDDGSAAITRSF